MVSFWSSDGGHYYYEKNAQGDITGIINLWAQEVAKYTYDSWGNMVGITDGNGNDVSGNAGHIANQNPLRYRGYYYDKETGYYYLQSRYYDPEWGRFLNGDDSEILNLSGNQLLGTNLFAYCSNDPVNQTDPTGYFRIRKDQIALAVNLAILAIPAIRSISSMLRNISKARKLVGTVAIHSAKVVSRLYGKVIVASKILSLLNGVISMFARYTIGDVIANVLGKIFRVERARERQYIWWGPYKTYEFVRFW